jgi:hypothetical protein
VLWADRLEAECAYWGNGSAFAPDTRAAGLAPMPVELVVLGPGGELVPTNNGHNGGMTEARLINTLEQPTFITADASRSRLDLAEEAQSLSGALDAADTIEARDSLERMLAHQLATVHVSAMKTAADLNRRLDYLANVRGEESERVNIQATRLANAVGRLMSTCQQGVLTVQRLRSGGKQTVVVQHVHVNEGGQAVVAGKVGRGARGRGTAGGKVRKSPGNSKRRPAANVSTVRTLPRAAEHGVGMAAPVTGLRCRTGDAACTVDLAPDLARQRDWSGRAGPTGSTGTTRPRRSGCGEMHASSIACFAN